jgi:hypothetical protein
MKQKYRNSVTRLRETIWSFLNCSLLYTARWYPPTILELLLSQKSKTSFPKFEESYFENPISLENKKKIGFKANRTLNSKRETRAKKEMNSKIQSPGDLAIEATVKLEPLSNLPRLERQNVQAADRASRALFKRWEE